MIESESSLRPLLARYPDARLGKAPLLEPILFPYLGLIFGVAAGLAGAYNAIVLRRVRLALLSVLISLTGCVLFYVTLVIARSTGLSIPVVLIISRSIHFALGGVLYFLHRPHFRGHQFHDGSTVPMLPSYLAAIMLSVVLPWRVTLVLLGGLIVR